MHQKISHSRGRLFPKLKLNLKILKMVL